MKNIKKSMKAKLDENIPALVAIAGMSTLLSAVYFAGKSKGGVTIFTQVDEDGRIVYSKMPKQ